MKQKTIKHLTFSRNLTLTLLATAVSALAHGQANRDLRVETIPINNNGNVNITLDVADGRDVVNIGDYIAFCFEVSKPGYISLWDIGTSGKVSKIYPFQEQSAVHQVAANQRKCVGDTRFKVVGPTGTENVVLYWTEEPGAQIERNGFRDQGSFIRDLDKHAKDLVQDGSWDDWAAESVSFEIIGANANLAVESIDNIARTRSNYDDVYVVAFGANVGELKKTNDDARLFTTMAASSFDIPKSNMRLYENAYRRDFEEGFEWLKNTVGPNDLVLFYYSGHGTKIRDDNGDEADGMDEALVPYDIENEANLNRPEKYIRDDELKNWLNGIQTGAVVSIFDACHSGGMHKGFAQGALLNARSKFFSKGNVAGKLPQYKGMQSKGSLSRDIVDAMDGLGNGKTKYAMMAASDEMEYALEVPNEGGIFTVNLRDALQKSGQSRDWSEMSETLSRNVIRASNGHQTPTTVDPDNALKNLKLDSF